MRMEDRLPPRCRNEEQARRRLEKREEGEYELNLTCTLPDEVPCI